MPGPVQLPMPHTYEVGLVKEYVLRSIDKEVQVKTSASSGTGQMSSSLAFPSLNSSLMADCHNPSFDNGRIISQQTS